MQCLKSVGTANPLILFDEIDKVASLLVFELAFCFFYSNIYISSYAFAIICLLFLGSLVGATLATQPVRCWRLWIQSRMQNF